MRKKDNDNDKDNNDNQKELGPLDNITNFLYKPDLFQNVFDSISAKIPTKLKLLVPSLKIALLSFVTGSAITIIALVYPVYKEVNQYEQPITLFETILSDLDRAYVDEVNTQKLFETGVSAMLRSLDPYTEYYDVAKDVQESVMGKYAGVGLVIAGSEKGTDAAMESSTSNDDKVENADEEDDSEDTVANIFGKKVQKSGITVVNAFEGYAFDYGMRVGDKILAVDGVSTQGKSVEQVRNLLRGEPNTEVQVSFARDGVEGVNQLSIPRRVVRISDVKCATLVKTDGPAVGYIQLSSFSADAGREVRNAILYLQEQGLKTDRQGLQGLVLDLRGNPGGLLTSAVDVASAFVPKNSDIVSARGRGFPGVIYRSRVEPLLPADVKLVVLTNGQTASAAEIVSGAIQDLDVGVILGNGRTYGKGLVQNVEELPFNRALKFTVAKYYTPSGRCIQSVNYKEGGGLKASEASFKSTKVKDKNTFYTKAGREVKDGGGVEADFKISSPKASALEVTLLREGVFADFAAEWSKNNRIDHDFAVTDETYKNFIQYVESKQKNGDIKLEAIYSSNINSLARALKQSGYKGSENELQTLKSTILHDIRNDFSKYKKDIKEDIAQNILARYVPERMLIERGLKDDVQVEAAVNLIKDQGQFDKLLARNPESAKINEGRRLANVKEGSMNTAWNEDSISKSYLKEKILFDFKF